MTDWQADAIDQRDEKGTTSFGRKSERKLFAY